MLLSVLQLDPRLAALQRNQNPGWYQTLSRLMVTKYGTWTRQFQSQDNQVCSVPVPYTFIIP